MRDHSSPLEVLTQYWGYSAFRPLQEEIIASVLEGKDTLALMPTGGGKSICYQVPALFQEGICLVISPLIALMKDQVFQLKQRNIQAEAIYSGMYHRDIDRILDNCVYGQTKLLYLSPERLQTDIAQERIRRMKVNLIAVDEAHCISQWGYDFRPAYLQICDIRELHPKVPILALTATATKEVVVDIQDKLEFRKENVFQMSFERKNLSYVVLKDEHKLGKALEIFQKVKGSGIAYVRTRRKTKEVAQFLRKKGIAADYYHAGLLNEMRSAKQEAWLQDKIRVMVATNAFGMGIDKANVRSVVHLDVPDGLEAYYQEAGRAGRDGEKAYAVLLYRESDRLDLEKRYIQAFPEMDEIRGTYQALGSYFQLAVGGGSGKSYDMEIQHFVKTFGLDLIKTYNCLKILEQSGWIVLSESVYVPSSLRVIVSKDTLYDYQLRNRKMDPILKTILRTYQGAFNNRVHIREQQLAGFLKMPLPKLKRSLEILQKDGIIEYLPQKEKPQIVFAEERVGTQNLTIDTALYAFRKQRFRERIRHMMAYGEKGICRSQQLLAYFGQERPPACGTCDICLGRNKTELSQVAFERYKEKIHLLLKRDQLPIAAVVDSFSPKRRDEVLKTLEYLLDEGVLEEENELLRWRTD
ncbi:MAG: ATP-dependent DNA helicase RecQ [Bacteroidota bacterium]